MPYFSDRPEGYWRVRSVPGTGYLTAVLNDIALTLDAMTPTVATATTTSAQVVAANSARTNLVIINLGSVNVSLGFAATAVSGSGITLVPNGVFEMATDLYNRGAVNAIAASGTATLSIQEYN